MIPEPQRTYVLELLAALGPSADDFVVAGAQAPCKAEGSLSFVDFFESSNRCLAGTPLYRNNGP